MNSLNNRWWRRREQPCPGGAEVARLEATERAVVRLPQAAGVEPASEATRNTVPIARKPSDYRIVSYG